MIRIIQSKDVGALLKRKAARLSAAEETVRPILEGVRIKAEERGPVWERDKIFISVLRR